MFYTKRETGWGWLVGRVAQIRYYSLVQSPKLTFSATDHFLINSNFVSVTVLYLRHLQFVHFVKAGHSRRKSNLARIRSKDRERERRWGGSERPSILSNRFSSDKSSLKPSALVMSSLFSPPGKPFCSLGFMIVVRHFPCVQCWKMSRLRCQIQSFKGLFYFLLGLRALFFEFGM